MVGDALSQAIIDARDLLVDFTDLPFGVRGFYEHAGLATDAARIATEHAVERARDSPNADEDGQHVSAWALHNGATYWLSWHWSGSESSRTFREYRRTANDLLFNPGLVLDRVEEHHREQAAANVRRGIVSADELPEDVDPADLDTLDDDELAAVLDGHSGVAQTQAAVQSLEDQLGAFEETEDRLDRIEAAIENQPASGDG